MENEFGKTNIKTIQDLKSHFYTSDSKEVGGFIHQIFGKEKMEKEK